ncbi:gastrula zinc finger protein XlCGF57.1-like isoform X2 [Thalassophryne amazonica]|uniref:gastrula zinc finger protein XlCGF57.1-like isoform X2 n=1 Tax=Thalassophryne amazonica TaxID=390379 RepID=UPI00147117CF|nr:gastrula zinc finger protein XlCGF57.1-like isoform X2 [Thalassophryne amazonica]
MQNVLMNKDGSVPHVQRVWSLNPDQDDPVSSHIKEEQEERCTSQKEEANFTMLSFMLLPIKNETNKEKPQVLQLHQNQVVFRDTVAMKTESDGVESRRAEPVCNSDPSELNCTVDMHKWSLNLDQKEREPSHIKEQQEQLRISQEEALQRLDSTKLSFSPTPLKSETDNEEHHISWFYFGGPQPESNENASGSNKHMNEDSNDSVDSDFWKETRERQSGLKAMKNNEASVSDMDYKTDKTLTCAHCGKGFLTESSLLSHRACHSAEKLYSCLVCGAGFASEEYLELHKTMHLGENHHQCLGESSRLLQCRRKKKKQVETGHSEDCGPPKPASSDCKCMIEASEDGNKYQLDSLKNQAFVNMKFNTRRRTFSCIVCDKTFGHRSHFKTHMRIHTGEKPFSCSECGKRFGNQGNQYKHMRSHTEEKPFRCSECGKSFGFKNILKTHMRIHTGEKPFRCSVCSKLFIHRSSLTYHMRGHTNEKCFSCSVCKKHFRQSGSVAVHMRLHTGDRPHRCLICSKSFIVKRSLTEHMSVHTGEKLYNCSLCGKGFTHKQNFTMHARVHTGEKKFRCRLCGKGFNRKCRFKNHTCLG